MRALTLFLLTACLAGPALAKLELITPPAPTTAPAAAPAPSASGKIQIGYDKRADYPKIKQTLSGRALQPNAADTKTTTANAAPATTPNLNGTIFNPSQPTTLPQRFKPTPKPVTTQAPTATAPTPAEPAKPRSDSALRSDSSPARDAAKASQTEAAAKAAADKEKAEALGAAIAAAQKAGAIPMGALPALPATR